MRSGRGRTSEARADRLEQRDKRGGGGGPTARAKDRARRSAHSLKTCPLQHLYTHSATTRNQSACKPRSHSRERGRARRDLMRERRHSWQTGFGEKESKRERRPNAGVELQLALTPVVREGEKGSSLLSVSSFCGAACLAKTVTELGRRDAMRCAASSKTSPRSGSDFQRRPAACRTRSHGPQ